jgi:hypothetical protein
MSINITSIDIHRVKKIVFSDDNYKTTRWLKMQIVCDTGHETDGISLFYGSPLEPEDVTKAMITYLESKGYGVSKSEKEHADARPETVQV